MLTATKQTCIAILAMAVLNTPFIAPTQAQKNNTPIDTQQGNTGHYLNTEEQTQILNQLNEFQHIIKTKNTAHLLTYLPPAKKIRDEDFINAFLDPESDNDLCLDAEPNTIFTVKFISQCPTIWTYLNELTLLQIEANRQIISTITEFEAPKGYEKKLYAQFIPSKETELDGILTPGVYIEILTSPLEDNLDGEENAIYYIFEYHNSKLTLNSTFRLP